MNHQEWKSRVLSWRGAIYQDLGRWEDAIADFEESLDKGATNIIAMTKNRLARVYMSIARRDKLDEKVKESNKNWEIAEKLLSESYESAQDIPDYVYWLGSLARIITVAVEKNDISASEQFRIDLDICLSEIPHSDANSLGIAYFALGRLALLENNIEQALDDTFEGINSVVEYGAYAKTDVGKRLEYLEHNLLAMPSADIRLFGTMLLARVREHTKSLSEREKRIYRLVRRKLHQWSNWGRGKNDTE